jgi:hypothetical protein
MYYKNLFRALQRQRLEIGLGLFQHKMWYKISRSRLYRLFSLRATNNILILVIQRFHSVIRHTYHTIHYYYFHTTVMIFYTPFSSNIFSNVESGFPAFFQEGEKNVFLTAVRHWCSTILVVCTSVCYVSFKT